MRVFGDDKNSSILSDFDARTLVGRTALDGRNGDGDGVADRCIGGSDISLTDGCGLDCCERDLGRAVTNCPSPYFNKMQEMFQNKLINGGQLFSIMNEIPFVATLNGGEFQGEL